MLALLFCGLIAVAGSAATEPARSPTAAIRGGLVAGVAALAALAWVGARQRGARSAVTLAAASGLAYGGVALAARLLSAGDGTFLVGDGLVRLLTDPLLWALLGYGALGLVTFAMALQRGPVTTVAAVVVVGETIAPALVGLALLGDRARAGPVLARRARLRRHRARRLAAGPLRGRPVRSPGERRGRHRPSAPVRRGRVVMLLLAASLRHDRTRTGPRAGRRAGPETRESR